MLQTNHNFLVQNFEEIMYKTQFSEKPIKNLIFK